MKRKISIRIEQDLYDSIKKDGIVSKVINDMLSDKYCKKVKVLDKSTNLSDKCEYYQERGMFCAKHRRICNQDGIYNNC